MNERQRNFWSPKQLLVMYGMTMLFITALCSIAVWFIK